MVIQVLLSGEWFRLWNVHIYKLFTAKNCVTAVSGQVCTAPETVGSLVHDEMIITADQTYILTGYRVQCEGIVTTWEFCYQILGAPSVTFYPGIWENNGRSGSDTMYSLIQANTVTFDPNGFSSFSCHNYTLPVTEQFTAPSGSVVGLYSNRGTARPLLLHSATNNNQITTYQVNGNQSSVSVRNRDDVNYNIAIRVYFSKYLLTTCTLIIFQSCNLKPKAMKQPIILPIMIV